MLWEILIWSLTFYLNSLMETKRNSYDRSGRYFTKYTATHFTIIQYYNFSSSKCITFNVYDTREMQVKINTTFFLNEKNYRYNYMYIWYIYTNMCTRIIVWYMYISSHKNNTFCHHRDSWTYKSRYGSIINIPDQK